MISYRIDCAGTRTHLFEIELTVPEPAAGQRLSLPVWIPGSYLVREFARHLSSATAEQAGRPVPLRQLDKASWQASCQGAASLVVRYRIYAFDTSVRAAFLGAARGFFNGTGLCLRVEGREHEPHALVLAGLPPGWEVATALEPRALGGKHELLAPDYDALVDTPVELGTFWRGRFDVAGVPHEFVVAGALPDFDGEQLLADTRRVCETEIAFWHGPQGQPPFPRYVFMLTALDDGHGGLEHAASTALLAARRDLPRRAVGPVTSSAATAAPNRATQATPDRSDGYIGVLGLISHEYFHAWNVKRLRPRDFAAIDYTRENYTELLWFFEGFTSYYDDLFIARSGIVDGPRYLKLLAKTVNAVQAAPGRHLQSLAETSFDAWVKFYRVDENTPNATISYYAKGALAALAFDLTLRSEGRGSLDDVMRRLWQASNGGPIDESDIAVALEVVGGRSFAPELSAWVHGTDELPLESLLARFGVAIDRQAATLAQRLGVRVSEGALTGVKVSHVLRGGSGEQLGLEAGDELIAAGGWRLRRLDDALRCIGDAGATTLLVSRDQRVLSLELDPATLGGEGSLQLRMSDTASAAERALCEAWLAG